MDYRTRRNYIKLLIVLAVAMNYRRSRASVALEGGHAVAYLEPIGYYGTSHVRAMVGRSYTDATVEIMPRDGLNIQPTRKIIVGDQPQDGTMQVEAPDGTLVDVPFYTSTDLQITGGEPGKVVVVELEDNRLPVAWYTMNGLDGTVARDYTFLHDGVASEVSEDAERYVAGGGSYRFAGSGMIEVPDSQLLRMQSMKFTSDVLAEGSGVQRIIEKGSNYALWIERPALDMLTAVFEVTTSDGVYQGSVTSPVAAGKFAHVVAAYRAGEIYVEIDGVNSVTPAMGVINYDASPMVIGRGLTGNLDNVKLWDLSFAAMSSFANGSERVEVTLDANGSASVPLYSTSAMGSAIAKMQKVRMQKGMIQAQEEYDGFVWDALVTIKTYHKDNFNNPSTGFLGMVSSRTGILVSEFALGALYAEGEGGAAIAGDMVSSLLYLGDARDAVFTGMKYYFGTAELADHVMLGLTGIALVPGADVLTVPAKRVVKAVRAIGTRLVKRTAKLVGDMGTLLKKGKMGEFYQKVNSYKDLFAKLLSDRKFMEMVEKTDPENFCTLAEGAAAALKPMGKADGGIFGASTAKKKCDEAGADWLDIQAELMRKLGNKWDETVDTVRARYSRSLPAEAQDELISNLTLTVKFAMDKGLELSPKSMEGMAIMTHLLGDNRKVENVINAAMDDSFLKDAVNVLSPDEIAMIRNNRFNMIMEDIVKTGDLPTVNPEEFSRYLNNMTASPQPLSILGHSYAMEIIHKPGAINGKSVKDLIGEGYQLRFDYKYNEASKRNMDFSLVDPTEKLPPIHVEVKDVKGTSTSKIMTQAKAFMDYSKDQAVEEESHLFLKQKSASSLSNGINKAKDARGLKNYNVHLGESEIYKPAGRVYP